MTAADGLLRPPSILPEVKRLEELLHELLGSRKELPSAQPYNRDAVRSYLRQRVFGSSGVMHQMSKAEAAELTNFAGNILNRGALHKELLQIIDKMAEEMTTQPEQLPNNEGGVYDQESRSDAQISPSTKQTCLVETQPLTQIQNLQVSSDQMPTRSMSFEPHMVIDMAKADPTPPQFRPLYQLITGPNGQTQLQQVHIPPESPSCYNSNIQTIPHSTPLNQPQEPSLASSAMPLRRRPMPPPPPGMRPASWRRLAPLALHTGALADFERSSSSRLPPFGAHAASSSMANLHNTEWANRFGLEIPISPAVPYLPYRPGSDAMYPFTVGGSSIGLQDLTRHGTPSFSVLTNKAVIPFVESAKEMKPAEWGVVKIGNVSYTRGNFSWKSLLPFLFAFRTSQWVYLVSAISFHRLQGSFFLHSSD